MNPLSKLIWSFSAQARKKRAELFRRYFSVDENTKILDLGSETGANIFNVLQSTNYQPQNVYIADIDARAVNEGNRRYGFNGVLIDETGNLPFSDEFFDIVYCSSVIEHTTVPKSAIWNLKNHAAFRAAAWKRQTIFAREITRLGKQYFVQTPARSFPIESHTWLPLVGYLPRQVFLPILRTSNRFWIKQAEPDFNLLNEKDMKELFPNAEIICEKKLGLTKSVMAVKTDSLKSE